MAIKNTLATMLEAVWTAVHSYIFNFLTAHLKKILNQYN